MGAWQQIAPLPDGLYAASAVYHPGTEKVYVFGGRRHLGVVGFENRTVYVLDPEANTWTTGALMPAPGTLHYHEKAFVAPDGRVHVLNVNGFHARYDPAADTWDYRAGIGNTTDSWFGFQDAAGRIYALFTAGSNVLFRRYDPVTDAWANLPSVPGEVNTGGAYAGVIGADGNVYVSVDFWGTLVKYDPAAGTWTRTAGFAAEGEVSRAAVSRLPNGLIVRMPARHFRGGAYVEVRRVDGYDPAAGTWTMGVIPDFIGPVFDWPAVASTPDGDRLWIIGGFGGTQEIHARAEAFMYLQNRPPTAPTLRTLAGGVLVNTAVRNRARHDFNDPDEGDSQAMFDWRHRIVGSASWTTGTVESPNPWYEIPAGDLDPGNYERQVRTYDSSLEPSPWAPSGFFTAADPPPGPTILYPINGQLAEQVERVEWSVGAQYAYQVRRVADDGDGNPVADPTGPDVYFDTGEVVDALTRKLPLTFATNHRDEHVQIRIKATAGGLFSGWVTVGVEVSYTPPPAPEVTIYADGSRLLLMIVNPAPEGGDPPAVYNDVLIDDGKGQGLERKATLIPTNTAYRYRTPVSRRDYGPHVEVIAVAANGATSSSNGS